MVDMIQSSAANVQLIIVIFTIVRILDVPRPLRFHCINAQRSHYQFLQMDFESKAPVNFVISFSFSFSFSFSRLNYTKYLKKINKSNLW